MTPLSNSALQNRRRLTKRGSINPSESPPWTSQELKALREASELFPKTPGMNSTAKNKRFDNVVAHLDNKAPRPEGEPHRGKRDCHKQLTILEEAGFIAVATATTKTAAQSPRRRCLDMSSAEGDTYK